MFYIYKIESLINGKLYIGITKNFKRRKTEHRCALKNRKHYNFLLQKHYDKHCYNKMFENVFTMDVIETVSTKHECSLKEIYWIDYYKTLNYTLFNLTVGGDGIILNEELEKERISKIRNKQKSVFVYTLDGEFVKQFRCLTEAGEYFGIEPSRISSSIRNKFRCDKYIFSREIIKFDEYTSRLEVPIYTYCVNGEFVKKYKSITEAAKKLNLNRNAVSNALHRGIRYKDYLFFREPKQFNRYVPAKSYKLVYINVYNSLHNLIDMVEGLTECAKKYNINVNSLNSRCRRKSVIDEIYFEKTYRIERSIPEYL